MNELLPIIRRKRRPLVVETNAEKLKPEILKAEPVKVETVKTEEDGGQKPEDRGQKPEDGGQKAEGGTKTLQAESERRLTSAATETTAPDANVTPKRKKR